MLIELRCTCKPKGREQSPLLAKAGGKDFQIELKCRFCKRHLVFRWPHPMGFQHAEVRNERLERKEKQSWQKKT